jgi:hypothetical protein
MNLPLMNLISFKRVFVAFNMSIVCATLYGVLILVAEGHCFKFWIAFDIAISDLCSCVAF